MRFWKQPSFFAIELLQLKVFNKFDDTRQLYRRLTKKTDYLFQKYFQHVNMPPETTFSPILSHMLWPIFRPDLCMFEN